MTDGSAPDATALAVVASRLDDVREDIAQLRGDISSFRAGHVTRGEWEQRNQHSDSKFAALGREIGDLRTELNSRRAPWWSVVGAAAAGVALLLNLIETIP